MFRPSFRLPLFFFLLTLASTCCHHRVANAAVCTEFQETIELFPELSMSYIINVHDQSTGQGTLTVQAVLQRVGWLGIGFSDNGLMAPSTAIVALPNEPVGDSNPAKYHITSAYDGGMQRDMEPSLTDASIRQDENTTILAFTIPLLRQGETPILFNDTNHIIYAFGYGNGFSYHADRDSVSLKFTPCLANVEDENANDEAAEDLAVEMPTGVPQTEAPVDKVTETPTGPPTTETPEEEEKQEEQQEEGEEEEEHEHEEPEHDVQSCLKYKNRVQLSPLLTLDYVVEQLDNRVVSDYPDGIFSAQLTYQGLGCLDWIWCFTGFRINDWW